MTRILTGALALLLVVLAPAGVVYAGHKTDHAAGGGQGGAPPGGGGPPSPSPAAPTPTPSPSEGPSAKPVPSAVPTEAATRTPPPFEPAPTEPAEPEPTPEPEELVPPPSEPPSAPPPAPAPPPDQAPAFVETDTPISVNVLGAEDVRVEVFALSEGEISGFRTLPWAVLLEDAGEPPPSPYVVRFRIDRSALSLPYPPESIAVFCGGALVPPCADGLDPCVEVRAAESSAGVAATQSDVIVLTVRTTLLNTFAFGVPASGCPELLVSDGGLADAGDHEVACLATWDLTVGMVPGRYEPKAPLTRVQLATFLVRLLVLVEAGPPPAPDRFPDDAGSVHEANIDRAAGAGVLVGYLDGAYRPDEAASSGQVASVLVADYLLATDGDLGARPESHLAALQLLANLGVLTGDGGGDPGAPVSRGAFALVVARLLDRFVLEGLFFPTA